MNMNCISQFCPTMAYTENAWFTEINRSCSIMARIQLLRCSWLAASWGIALSLCALPHVWRFATPWTMAHQTPHPWGFSRKNTSRLPFPPPEDLPNPGIKPTSPPWAEGFFITEAHGSPHHHFIYNLLTVYTWIH